MIWYGIIIGFAAGVIVVTLLYTPLVDKVKMFEQRMIRDKELIDDAIKALRRFEHENANLKDDLRHLYELVPREVYAQLYDDIPRKD